MNAGNLNSLHIYYLDLNPLIVSDFRVIILYRCPLTLEIEKAIKLAKQLNKIVIFDIDDLIIDTKYTNLIPYLKTLSVQEKKLYDEHVVNMGKTLSLCDSAITTTEGLANELMKYVKRVFINRNVASDKMFELSEKAIEHQKKYGKIMNKDKIIIGYFSGSITHNSDIEMIAPSLIKILKEFENVNLLFFGLIDIPQTLKNFQNRIETKSFINWQELPENIVNVDINIAPIEENIFNSAKSENKWVETSLVKVPTVASNFGAFKHSIQHGQTGLLCETNEEWYQALKNLIHNITLKKYIAENAYNFCREKYYTLNTGNQFMNYINSIAHKHIGFVLPSLGISGGVRVILTHALVLQENGWDVDLFSPYKNTKFYEYEGHKFNVISPNTFDISAQFDVLVATMFTTFYSVLNYTRTKRKLYLVQNHESEFYKYGDILRMEAERTYSTSFGIQFITISKWCENWLKEKYKQKSKYAPNGINSTNWVSHKRNLNKSVIRILIEGDNLSYHKNVDESFQIVDKLDKNKFEIWYMSYNAQPKKWYRVDKNLNRVPFDKVNEIYSQCDILIKSSIMESFSYPPLEMMATGGYCIIAPNPGNIEYLKNEENCLFYQLGNINSAIISIERLISDINLQQHLYEKGLETARERNLENFKEKILALYE